MLHLLDRDRGLRVLVLVCLGLVATSSTGLQSEAEDWPEWRGKGRVGVWNETGIIETFPAGGLPVTWRTPINQGYAGPSVADGRVFLTDARSTTVNHAVERALALDEQTGRILWTREWETDYTGLESVYAIGPRATPTVDGDRVYVLGAMGKLFALDVKTGDVLWQKDYVKDLHAEIASWGMTSAPIVEGDLLICLAGGSPDAKVIAFNKFTGEEKWHALSSDWETGYNQPIIVDAAGVRQLIIWHPQAISALDPATGRVLWEVDHKVAMGMTVPTAVWTGSHLFVTSHYGGARMLKLDETKPGATLVWSGPGAQDVQTSPDTLNSTISTPVIQGDYIYGLEARFGMLRCLELTTGKQLWEVPDVLKERAQHGTAFFVRNGDRYFISNDRGELIIAKLSPKGYEEIDRTKLIEPTHPYVRRRQLPFVSWTHPAYANKHLLIRNDTEIVRFSLAKEE